MRKRLMLTLAVTSLLVAGFLVLQPHLVFKQFRAALLNGDEEALRDVVDFPSLKENLRERASVYLRQEAEKEVGSSASAGLVPTMASPLVTSMVEELGTPKGLTDLVKEGNVNSSTFLTDVSYRYNSLSRFTVAVPNGQFVFRREGFSWKLTQLLFPLSDESDTPAASATWESLCMADESNFDALPDELRGSREARVKLCACVAQKTPEAVQTIIENPEAAAPLGNSTGAAEHYDAFKTCAIAEGARTASVSGNQTDAAGHFGYLADAVTPKPFVICKEGEALWRIESSGLPVADCLSASAYKQFKDMGLSDAQMFARIKAIVEKHPQDGMQLRDGFGLANYVQAEADSKSAQASP